MAAPSQAQVAATFKIGNVFSILNANAPINTGQYNDISNWASLGLSTGHGDLIKIIYQVIDPSGVVPYQNANWVAQTFGAPDTSLTSLTAATYNLNVLTGTSVPIPGIYTYNFLIQITPVGFSAVVYSISLSGGTGINLDSTLIPIAPALYPSACSLQISDSFNCGNATFTATDTTGYNTPTNQTINSIVRSLVVEPPVAAQQSPVTTTAATVTLGAPSNQLWTGTYASSLTSTVTYQIIGTSYTTIVHLSLIGQETLVTCTNNLCELKCCLTAIAKALANAYSPTPNTQKICEAEKALILCSSYYTLIEAALICQDTTTATTITQAFWVAAANYCNQDCGCGCPDTPGPVVPTSIATGPTGAAGPQGATGAAGATGPSGAAGVNGMSVLYNNYTPVVLSGSTSGSMQFTLNANTVTVVGSILRLTGRFGAKVGLGDTVTISFNGQDLLAVSGIPDFKFAGGIQGGIIEVFITMLSTTTAIYEAFITPIKGGLSMPLLIPNVTNLGTIDFTTNMNINFSAVNINGDFTTILHGKVEQEIHV